MIISQLIEMLMRTYACACLAETEKYIRSKYNEKLILLKLF